MSRPEVRPPAISRSRWTAPVKEADHREGPQGGEHGPSAGRRRKGPVSPRGRRKAAAGTEITTEEGAAAGAGQTHRSHGRSDRGRAATRTETALENGAAASALHPSAHEHPRYLMVRCSSGADSFRISDGREDLYRLGGLRGPPSLEAEASTEIR